VAINKDMNPVKGLLLLASLIALFPAILAAQPSDNVIRPGKGWKGAVIGASQTSVEAELGKPEITTPGTEDTFATYTTRGLIVRYAGTNPVVVGLNFLGDSSLYTSSSIKFGSFTGLPDKNIKWRATEAEVIAANGPPTERSSFMQSSSKLEIAELTYPGAQFAFKGNKLFQIKVMAMPAATPTAAAKPVAPKKDGKSLFDAVKTGDEALVRQLIAEGSDLNYEFKGDTTLENAILYRKVNIARILLEAGADPNLQDAEYGATPLFVAAQMRDDDTLALLLDKYKSNPNHVAKGGRTVLHQAADFSNAAGTEMLLKAGANPNVVDDQGRSPLDLARASDASYVIKYLEPVTDLALIAQLKAKAKSNPAPTPTPVAPVVEDDDDDDFEVNPILINAVSIARKDGFRKLEEGETKAQGRNENSESGSPRIFISSGTIYQFVAIGKDVQTVNAIMNGTLLAIPCDECRTSISQYWTSIASTKSRGYAIVSLQFTLLNVQNNWISLIPKAQKPGSRVRWILFSKPGK
jgi:ankyrin repeat protein